MCVGFNSVSKDIEGSFLYTLWEMKTTHQQVICEMLRPGVEYIALQLNP